MRRNDAFTLIELLVSISIIGILMAILIPAVNAARESGRNAQCQNNLRQIGLACLNYVAAFGHTPGYLNDYGTWSPTTGDPADPANTFPSRHAKVASWAVSLFPYLDQQPLYETWTQDRYPILTDHDPGWLDYKPSAVPNLDVLMCPSASELETSLGGANSYASNNGYYNPGESFPMYPPVPPHLQGNMEESDKPANGVFFPSITGRLGFTQDAHPVLKYSSIGHVRQRFEMRNARDGLSSTILFTENLYQPPWHFLVARNWYPDHKTFTHLNPLIDRRIKSHGFPITARNVPLFTGIVWHYYDDSGIAGAPPPPAEHRINGPYHDDLKYVATTIPDFDAAGHCKPSSNHREGVNAVFLDGSVRFIRETIPYRVFQALMTPHGKASVVPNPEFILQDDQWH